MKDEECVIGAAVICVYKGGFYGKIGTITDVHRAMPTGVSSNYVQTFFVKDDNGDPIGADGWSFTSSFDLYDPFTVRLPVVQKILKAECPCGINRKDCEYHK